VTAHPNSVKTSFPLTGPQGGQYGRSEQQAEISRATILAESTYSDRAVFPRRGTGGPSGAIQREQTLACARIGRVSRIAYVSGRLGAGKSTLAAPLAAELGYSLVTKDLIKETLHDALYVPGDGEVDEAWSQRLGAASWELLFTLAARAGDMVIEANFHPYSELEVDKLRGLGDRVVEVHCACPAEVAVARYNARLRHEVHWLTTATLATMDRYDRPVGVGSLITVDTTGPVDVASVAAEVRRLHASRTG
jgi:predicted kinase